MKEFMISHTTGFILGIILDLFIGDPHFMPHPVRAIGSLTQFLEKKLLGDGVFQYDLSSVDKAGTFHRDDRKEKKRGILLWFAVIISTAGVTYVVMRCAYYLSRVLGIAVEAILTCYVMAARSLYDESMSVYKKLKANDTEGARHALSMIVGRDTAVLDEEGIIKAAVETVAENTSDGVIAPFLYTAAGGPVLGFLYKAVNTMDSMIGYKNEKYENFGFFAARADDLFNFLPSRISAVLMIIASALLGLFSGSYSSKNAYGIWIRDRLNHRSPNSAQTESVCAGALGLMLGGTHLYGGVLVEKPAIGDETRKPENEDIKRAGILMFGTLTLAILPVMVILLLII